MRIAGKFPDHSQSRDPESRLESSRAALTVNGRAGSSHTNARQRKSDDEVPTAEVVPAVAPARTSPKRALGEAFRVSRSGRRKLHCPRCSYNFGT